MCIFILCSKQKITKLCKSDLKQNKKIYTIKFLFDFTWFDRFGQKLKKVATIDLWLKYFVTVYISSFRPIGLVKFVQKNPVQKFKQVIVFGKLSRRKSCPADSRICFDQDLRDSGNTNCCSLVANCIPGFLSILYSSYTLIHSHFGIL